jgi:hypothetical protein
MRNGKTKSVEYHSWSHMRQRCTNSKDQDFPNYGGRGITVCERWMNSFESFLEDMGPRPTPRHSIDRIDSNGNYEPGNCRWASPKVQGMNTRRVIQIEVDGRTNSVMGWANEIGVSRDTLERHLAKGKTMSEISQMKREGRLKSATPKMISYRGKTQNQLAWAREFGIPQPTLSWQLARGKNFEEIAARAGY